MPTLTDHFRISFLCNKNRLRQAQPDKQLRIILLIDLYYSKVVSHLVDQPLIKNVAKIIAAIKNFKYYRIIKTIWYYILNYQITSEQIQNKIGSKLHLKLDSFNRNNIKEITLQNLLSKENYITHQAIILDKELPVNTTHIKKNKI